MATKEQETQTEEKGNRTFESQTVSVPQKRSVRDTPRDEIDGRHPSAVDDKKYSISFWFNFLVQLLFQREFECFGESQSRNC